MVAMDSDLAGKLIIELNWYQGQIQSVQPHLNRPLETIGQWLSTMPPELACEQVAHLFVLCGQSHALAAKLAHGLVHPDAKDTQRLLQRVQLENWREGVIRLVEYWGYPADDDEVLALVKRLMHSASGSMTDACKLDIRALQYAWEQWLTGSNTDPSAREQQWQAELNTRLTQRFGQLDMAIDTQPLLQWLNAQAKALLADARQRADSVLDGGWIRSHDVCRTVSPGLGEVNTSRGWLSHRCDDIHWHITAPTDRHFGPYADSDWLNRQLAGVRVAESQAEALVTQVVQALNPCVAFQVRVRHGVAPGRPGLHA